MKTRFFYPLAITSLFAMLASVNAHAQSFDFSSPGNYTSNFYNTFTTSGSSNLLTTSGGAIVHTAGGSGTSISTYDTSPDTTASNFFTSVTVSFDFSTSVFNSSFGVVFGGTNRTNANLALFNINNNAGGAGSSTDQLRIFNGGDWNLVTGVNGNTSTPAANVQLSSGTASSNTNNGWTIDKTYHAVFNISYTSATTANVSFTISDPSNALASVSATANGLTLSATGGEIGLRTGFSAAGGTLTIDNVQISAIPEPSTFALLGGLGALGFALSRRRR